MSSEADEHERALALEMSFQRRQWDKMQKLDGLMEEQASRVQDFERRLSEQADRSRSLEERAEAGRQEARAAAAAAVERCAEEREARQKETHALRLQLKSLEGRCEELVREATKDLAPTIKAQQEMSASNEAFQRRQDELARELFGRVQDLERQLAEEREARQSEMHALRLQLKTLEGRCEELVREAARDLSLTISKAQQEMVSSAEAMQRRLDELARDLLSRLQDQERLLAEERVERAQEQKGLQALLSGLQAAHEEAERGTSRDRDARRQEQQELRTSLAALERRCAEMVRDTSKDLSKLVHSKNQECAELVRDFGSHCKNLGREATQHRDAYQRDHQGLRGSLGELERQYGELARELTAEVGEKHLLVSARAAEVEKRCGLALKELAARMDDVEHNLTTHTHQFTSTKTYKCGLALTPTAHMSCSRTGAPQLPEGLSTMSTLAGSEL